jgi:ATP-dependent RNA helicase DeaD
LSDAYPKPRNLLYVLEMEAPENAIIFCNTKDDTELVTAVLNRNGFDAELLNGDLPQKERERVMAKIKRGEVAFMVATDLAARGIDISDLGHVINYSLPEDPAVYLHRVGRTGRIGKTGVALNLCSGKELASLTSLERKYNVKFEKREMPTAEGAMNMWTDRHVKELKEASQGTIYEGYLGLASSLKKRPDADDLIASMLRYFFTQRRIEKLRASGELPVEAPRLEMRPSRSRDERGRPGGKEGGRRERGSERGGRSSSREREPREERAARPASTSSSIPSAAPTAPAVGGRVEESAEAVTAPAAPVRERPARRDTAPAGARKLSDRELFDLLQAGKPLPPIDDPTGGGPSSGAETASERGPRRERSERRRREPRAEAPVESGQARVWVNLGKMDGVADESSLAQALEAAGAPSGKVKKSEIRGSYSYVHVAEEDVGAFEGLGGKQHGEKAIKVERAKAR